MSLTTLDASPPIIDDQDRGSIDYRRVRIGGLADGSQVGLPVQIVRGHRPGPTVYLGAGIHGDEIAGIRIVQRVLRDLDPTALSGSIIGVPVQNPLAVQNQHRFALQHLLRSPLDHLVVDPWMSFGATDVAGTYAQSVAATITALATQADVAIDVHTPTTGGRYVPFAFLPKEDGSSEYARALAVARAFSPDYILRARTGVYVGDGTLHVELTRRGVPTFGVELGEGGRIESAETIDRGVRGILGALREVGVIEAGSDSSVAQRPRVPELESMTAVRTEDAGYLETVVEVGDHVEGGQLIASVFDEYGQLGFEVTAPHEGPLMRLTTLPTVAAGDRVAQIGVGR